MIRKKTIFQSYLLFFVILTIASCGKKTETKTIETLDAFPITINMTDRVVKSIQCDELREPNIVTLDSFLIVLDSRYTEGFIRIFNNQTLELLASFGIVGNGPHEYLTPSCLYVDKKSRDIWFIDFQKSTFYCYPLFNILESKGMDPKHSIPFNYELMPIFNYHILENGNILIPTTRDTSLLTELNPKGEIANTYGVSKESRVGMDYQMQYNYFYYKSLTYNEEKGIAIGTFHYHDKVVCSNLKSGQTHEIRGQNYSLNKPLIHNVNIMNQWMAYTFEIRQTDEHVFSCYLGGDYYTSFINYPQEIHVFDWNANPVAKLVFPDPIISFDINKKGEVFVYANKLEENYQVYQLRHDDLHL